MSLKSPGSTSRSKSLVWSMMLEGFSTSVNGNCASSLMPERGKAKTSSCILILSSAGRCRNGDCLRRSPFARHDPKVLPRKMRASAVDVKQKRPFTLAQYMWVPPVVICNAHTTLVVSLRSSHRNLHNRDVEMVFVVDEKLLPADVSILIGRCPWSILRSAFGSSNAWKSKESSLTAPLT